MCSKPISWMAFIVCSESARLEKGTVVKIPRLFLFFFLAEVVNASTPSATSSPLLSTWVSCFTLESLEDLSSFLSTFCSSDGSPPASLLMVMASSWSGSGLFLRFLSDFFIFTTSRNFLAEGIGSVVRYTGDGCSACSYSPNWLHSQLLLIKGTK